MVYGMVTYMDAARKVTINVPEKLLKEAREVTGQGITETLVEGLRLLRRQKAYSEFQSLEGKLDLNINLDTLRERTRR
ncbi:MAG: hypothetical protein Q7T03_03795 [Deltaproteobacteria bacterium]|nr:hypothetical protein [Deltaproteobacteria bacterium]